MAAAISAVILMRDDEDSFRDEEPSVTAATCPSRRLLIVDPARRFGCEADRRFSDSLARSFCDAGFDVVWVIDADDALPDRPYAQLRRLLPPRSTDLHTEQQLRQRAALPNPLIERLDGWARATWRDTSSSSIAKAVALTLWVFVRVFYRLKYAIALLAWWCSRSPRVLTHLYWHLHGWTGYARRAARWSYWRVAHPFLRPCLPLAHQVCCGVLRIVGFPKGFPTPGPALVSEAASASSELVELLRALGTDDVLVFPSAELAQLETLFQLLPRLGLSHPLPTTLHVRFAHADNCGGDPAHDHGATLAARLRSGSPIRTIVLHAQAAGVCRALERNLGLRVHECQGDSSSAALLRRFAPASLPGSTVSAHDALDVPPSLVVDQFGPLVLLISALWGRVGSSAVFDAQMRYLVERGFIVARILIDHHPQGGVERAKRLEKLLAENFEQVRPHLHLVAERKDGFRHVWRLNSVKEYREGSPVRRIGMLLADATIDDPASAAWCADRAVLTVVNHLPHVTFAERLGKAPIVLETHDVYAKLLTTHGIPDFVPRGVDGDKRREADEMDVWGRVATCVNLSPEEHAVVARVAKRSVLARPYVNKAEITRRSWLEVMAANRLPASHRTTNHFDIIVWGDWHEGNVAGIRWFLEEVVDRHACLRPASILLVGRVVQGLPRRLLKRQGLHAVGFVDRIDDFFARSTVLVIPDRPGSTGASVKAIDALARGCCFSSTAAGLRGVTVEDTGLAPSNDPTALAFDIAHLLKSPDARRARAAVARRLYELNFSKAAYSEAWDAVLHSLLPGLPGLATSSSHAFPNSAAAPPPLSSGGLTCRSRQTERRSVPALEETPVSMPQTLSPKPRLSVVVCTYDRYDVLPDAIHSLLGQQLDPGSLEIIVVDNSPKQEEAARFRARFVHEPSVSYRLEPTPGLSHARNVGVAHACAELVAFMDDDAIAAPDWASHILSAFETFAGRAGIVGGRVLPRWVSARPPWLSDDLLGYLSIVDWGGQTRALRANEWLVGCNIAFDKQVLSSIGGFSRALGRIGTGAALLSNEDIEVAEKIHHAGRVSIYCPEALVHHVIDPARLTRAWFRRRSAWQAVSDYIKDPERMAAYSPAAVEHLRRELLDGSRGGLAAGFFGATEAPQEFKQEVALTYDLVAAVLGGGAELDSAGKLTQSTPSSSRIKARVRATAQASRTFRRVLHYGMRWSGRQL